MLRYFKEERIFSNIVTVFFLIIALNLLEHNYICASQFRFRMNQINEVWVMLFCLFSLKKNPNYLNWLESQV